MIFQIINFFLESPRFSPVLSTYNSEAEDLLEKESEPVEQTLDAYIREDNQELLPFSQPVVSVQPSTILYQPLENESPLRFFTEPSTYINLASLFESAFVQSERHYTVIPSTVPDQISISRPPMQPYAMFDSPLPDHAYSHTTQMALKRTMIIPNTDGAGSNTFVQNILIQTMNIQPESATQPGSATQPESATFSNQFISQRSFGFTKTAKFENNELKVCFKNK